MQEIQESLYVVRTNVREFINEQVLHKNRSSTFIQFAKHLSKLGRQFIRNIKLQTTSNFNVGILSAEIDYGLWDKPKYSIFSFIVKFEDIEN